MPVSLNLIYLLFHGGILKILCKSSKHNSFAAKGMTNEDLNIRRLLKKFLKFTFLTLTEPTSRIGKRQLALIGN